MNLKSQLSRHFTPYTPIDLSKDIQRSASVAVILKPDSEMNLSIGYIQRAENPIDPWSGHIAFPGGVRELFDPTPVDAAIRETLEETGIQLKESEMIAALDDIQGRKSGQLMNFFIRAHVFLKEENVTLSLDESEVADFRWIPLASLMSDQNKTTYKSYPAIDLGFSMPLWGLSYLITMNLLEKISASKL